MRDVVICEPVRTPIGRYGGMFKNLTAVDLGVTALRGLLDRTSLDPERIDDVIRVPELSRFTRSGPV